MRLLINLIFIVLFFFFFNNVVNGLIPAYKIFLKTSEEKNLVENELLITKAIENQFKFLQSEQVASIVKTKKSGYFDYYLPSKFIDYELTMFINQIFYISNLPQPNIYSFNKEEINHPLFKKIKITKYSFSVNQVLSYNDLIKLINNFENSSRIFTIDNLTLKSTPQSNLIETNMQISTYYFLP
jgi:hypothetical protein